MTTETLYDFIQRTLVGPEYRANQARKRFEMELILGNGIGYFEPSYVISNKPVILPIVIKDMYGRN